MASIKEIAKLANVSQGTASMVLNGKGDKYRISAATQRKILEAAKQLNYQPNISARRLRSGERRSCRSLRCSGRSTPAPLWSGGF